MAHAHLRPLAGHSEVTKRRHEKFSIEPLCFDQIVPLDYDEAYPSDTAHRSRGVRLCRQVHRHYYSYWKTDEINCKVAQYTDNLPEWAKMLLFMRLSILS